MSWWLVKTNLGDMIVKNKPSTPAKKLSTKEAIDFIEYGVVQYHDMFKHEEPQWKILLLGKNFRD